MQILHLDSRARRVDSSVYNAVFQLPRPILNARKIRLKSLQFTNTYHNITSDNNVLVTSSGSITIQPAYWNAQELINEINTQLTALWGGSGDPYIELVNATNSLIWTLPLDGPSIDCDASSIRHVLGLPHGTMQATEITQNTFTTQLYLALPQYISFSSPQLSGNVDNIFADQKESYQPFITIPVSVGYLSTQTYQPQYEQRITIDSTKHGITLSSIHVNITDPFTRREIQELTHWAMVIEVF